MKEILVETDDNKKIYTRFYKTKNNKFKEYYKINSSKGNLVWIKNCWHFIHTDSPDEYLKNIIEFIKK